MKKLSDHIDGARVLLDKRIGKYYLTAAVATKEDGKREWGAVSPDGDALETTHLTWSKVTHRNSVGYLHKVHRFIAGPLMMCIEVRQEDLVEEDEPDSPKSNVTQLR